MAKNEIKELEPNDWCSVAEYVFLIFVLFHLLLGICCCFYVFNEHFHNVVAAKLGLLALFSFVGNIVLIVLLRLIEHSIERVPLHSILEKFLFFDVGLFWLYLVIVSFILLLGRFSVIFSIFLYVIAEFMSLFDFAGLFFKFAIITQLLPFTVIYTYLMMRKAKKLENK